MSAKAAEPVAELREAFRAARHGVAMLFGRAYGDTKGRFTAGETILHTDIHEELPGDAFVTSEGVSGWRPGRGPAGRVTAHAHRAPEGGLP